MSLQQYSALYENDTGPFDRVSEPDEDDAILNSVTLRHSVKQIL